MSPVGLQESVLHQDKSMIVIRLLRHLKKKATPKNSLRQAPKQPVLPIVQVQIPDRLKYQKQHQQVLLNYFNSKKPASSLLLPLTGYELPLLGSLLFSVQGFEHVMLNYIALRTVIYSAYPFLYGSFKLNSLYLVSQDTQANIAFSVGLMGLLSALATLLYGTTHVLAASSLLTVLWVLLMQFQGRFVLKIGIYLIIAHLLTIACLFKLDRKEQPYRLKKDLDALKKAEGSLILQD